MVGDGLSFNKAAFEVGVDDACGLRGGVADVDRPGADFLFSGGEVADASVGLTSKNRLGAMLNRVLDKHNGVGLMDKLKRRFGSKTESEAQAS